MNLSASEKWIVEMFLKFRSSVIMEQNNKMLLDYSSLRRTTVPEVNNLHIFHYLMN